MTQFHIVGIDPSLSATGFASIRPVGPSSGTIRVKTIDSKPVPNAKYPHTLVRMRTLARRILDAVKEDMQDGDVLVVVMEGPIFGQATGQYHTRAGLWWLLYHLLEKLGMLVIIEPTKLKKYVTGAGNAPKDSVFATMIRNFPSVGIMNNNEADALGLASMAARELGFPMEPSAQRVNPGSLEGVDWPEYITQRRLNNG